MSEMDIAAENNEFRSAGDVLKKTIDYIFGHLITICIVAGLLYGYFKYVGKVEYVGRKTLSRKGKAIYYANHPSMMDPFLVLVLFYWRSVFRPRNMPWSPVARENFYPKDSKRMPIIKNIPYLVSIHKSRILAEPDFEGTAQSYKPAHLMTGFLLIIVVSTTLWYFIVILVLRLPCDDSCYT